MYAWHLLGMFICQLKFVFTFQVYIRINGTKGKLPKKQLLKNTKKQKTKTKKKPRFKFNRGSTHVFKFEGKDIGDVLSITLEVCRNIKSPSHLPPLLLFHQIHSISLHKSIPFLFLKCYQLLFVF